MIAYGQLEAQLQQVCQWRDRIARLIENRDKVGDVTKAGDFVITKHGGHKGDYGRDIVDLTEVYAPVENVLDGYDRQIQRMRAEAEPVVALFRAMFAQVQDTIAGEGEV